MSNSESYEDRITIEKQASTTHPLVEGLCNSQTFDTQTAPSLWNYFRWIFWTIFSGFIQCGRTLALFSFEQKPVAVVALEKSVNDDELCKECEIQYITSPSFDSAAVSVVVNESVCFDTFNRACVQSDLTVIDQTTDIFQVGTDCVATGGDSLKSFTEKVTPSFSLLPDCCDSWALSSGFSAESPYLDSSAYTLLSSLYVNSANGLIDTSTFEHTVEEIVQSVIPRNLSDCSEVTVCPEIRKMYAWNKRPMDCLNTDEKSNEAENYDGKLELFDSDKQHAYPGRLTMSNVVSPSLSPSTFDSGTTISESPCTSLCNSDVQFSFSDGKFQSLTWAMSKLATNNNNNNNNEDSAAQTQSPPLGAKLRQSRDKSPVNTVNSLRPPGHPGSSHSTQQVGLSLSENLYHSSEVPPKPKRSSSLKSHRTPPETPEPKSVRFADALGLDLETVRHVFDQEVPPRIPASATFGLKLDSDESIAKLGAKQFGLCFAQPGLASNFIRRVLNQTVCLEDAHVSLPRGMLTGTIRVRSLGFEKRVFIRITYNNWATYCDIPASYVQGSYDGTTDKFAFSVVFPDTMAPGDRAQFALRYESHTGEQFWDNNHGQNYSVACYAKATDLAGDGSWVHYL